MDKVTTIALMAAILEAGDRADYTATKNQYEYYGLDDPDYFVNRATALYEQAYKAGAGAASFVTPEATT